MTKFMDMTHPQKPITPPIGRQAPLAPNWRQMRDTSSVSRLHCFREASEKPRQEDVSAGFRAFSGALFEDGLIGMREYVRVFGGEALHHLTHDGRGFRDMETELDADGLSAIYSRAKYGSFSDISYLAKEVVQHLSQALDDPESHWTRLFRDARRDGDCVVMMTTGWRNVPSTANVIYQMVVDRINLKLAHLGLPTIINVKLPRLAPPCENYASLTLAERERVNQVQDHVIPGPNFYANAGVHVIFGDDVLITGATADKVFAESMRNGARSFRALYPIAIDPRMSLSDATIEERLNTVKVSGKLDHTLAGLLSEPDYVPILRTLRLVFAGRNHADFRSFLAQIPNDNWLRLYMAALGNDFLGQEECRPSLLMLRDHLQRHELLDGGGLV